MDPLTMMLLAQAIPTGINLVKAGVQGAKANKLSKTERPNYKIPEAVQQQLNQSRYLASMRELPGQNIMEGRIGENIGKGVSELKSVSANPADLASNVAKMYSSGNNSINDIGLQAGQQWLNNQSLLNQNLGAMGQYQDKQFDINEMQPYKNDMAASAALREGAFRNLSSAGQNIASGVGGYANMMYQQDMLDKLMAGSSGGLGSVMQDNGTSSAFDMGLGDQSSQLMLDTSKRGVDTAANDWGNQLSGNYQIPVKQKTMSEASQNPIINTQSDFAGANSPVSTQKMIDFLLKDMVRNQIFTPYR